jgi:hypothetical protein
VLTVVVLCYVVSYPRFESLSQQLLTFLVVLHYKIPFFTWYIANALWCLGESHHRQSYDKCELLVVKKTLMAMGQVASCW